VELPSDLSAAKREMPTAGKTGTTSQNFDKWFVGFSPYYVGAVWYGYDHNVSISSAESNRALQIWHDVMEKVHEKLEPIPFAEPKALSEREYASTRENCDRLCASDPRVPQSELNCLSKVRSLPMIIYATSTSKHGFARTVPTPTANLCLPVNTVLKVQWKKRCL